ncbi:hypothetical protein OHT59_19595 [Streptomyces sp. NBC_00243]|uniref:hypothetical protein n=1 Tax=Streptomyces sp. NBC_00243 TaxID=2975688 RepID=UPI002DDBF996|nr:hypothetical protein [Streptomyces sp. NBC_00243]WRZ20546.1 hypothetical protein OHT59_19595 [Streptomyces sp. NBC_00243]
MKRTALASSALALATLTACGSGTSDTTDAAAGPKASTSQAKQLSPAERLAKLMVTKADLGGDYVVKEYDLDGEYVFAKTQDEVTVDNPACAPLAYATNQLPLGDPQAFLTDHASKNVLSEGSNYVTLIAYEEDGKAESAVTGLSEAVASCGTGFTTEANGNSSTYDSVSAEKADPAGDESLAFKSTLTFRGITHTMHGAAVRSGDVVAVYFSVNGTAIANSNPSDAKLPAAVVKAQNAKLG